jgi:hypothetical protein
MIIMLVHLIVVLLVIGLLYYAVSLLPLPHPFGVVIKIAFILIMILVILYMFGPMLGMYPLR